MCGIAGVYLLDDSLKVNLDSMLDTMLDDIDHRGGDATGFVAQSDE
jgi:asparagine synthetase B (glutamine-hydrolysing)